MCVEYETNAVTTEADAVAVADAIDTISIDMISNTTAGATHRNDG
ncbi:hypothetical protein [Halorubrum aidingense]|nr:hypothetical protein [Halorubrum aidingense]